MVRGIVPGERRQEGLVMEKQGHIYIVRLVRASHVGVGDVSSGNTKVRRISCKCSYSRMHASSLREWRQRAAASQVTSQRTPGWSVTVRVDSISSLLLCDAPAQRAAARVAAHTMSLISARSCRSMTMAPLRVDGSGSSSPMVRRMTSSLSSWIETGSLILLMLLLLGCTDASVMRLEGETRLDSTAADGASGLGVVEP